MAEFVSGLPLPSHLSVRASDCVKFMSYIQTDIRVGCTRWVLFLVKRVKENAMMLKNMEKILIADGIPQILESWRPSITVNALTFNGKNEIDVKFFFFSPSFATLLLFLSISTLVSGKRHILKSKRCCHFGRCCFIFLYLSHSVCTVHSTVIHLWYIASVFYWTRLEGTIWMKCLESCTKAAIYTDILKQWINVQ